jgi:hypothetical protein
MSSDGKHKLIFRLRPLPTTGGSQPAVTGSASQKELKAKPAKAGLSRSDAFDQPSIVPTSDPKAPKPEDTKETLEQWKAKKISERGFADWVENEIAYWVKLGYAKESAPRLSREAEKAIPGYTISFEGKQWIAYIPGDSGWILKDHTGSGEWIGL